MIKFDYFMFNSKFGSRNRGLIKMLVLIFAGLLLLAYLGLNLRSIVGSDTFVENWKFVKESVGLIWNNYLKVPFIFIWSKVFIPFVWEPIVDNISNRQ